MSVPILKQGALLIATIQGALTDADLMELRDVLAQRVGQHRTRGVLVDVSAVDVMDSFATRMLRNIAYTVKLRGAETVIVGIQPEVAFTMVQLGLTLEGVDTALDFEEGVALLSRKLHPLAGHRAASPGKPGRPGRNDEVDRVG
jgi:rsbT antagonist protein RsbS